MTFATFTTSSSSGSAEGRNLAYDSLDDICNGRVWTGAQAVELGLVDALGDFQVAVDEACIAAELPKDDRVQVVPVSMPKERPAADPRKAAAAALGIRNLVALDESVFFLSTQCLRDLARRERVWLLGLDLPEV